MMPATNPPKQVSSSSSSICLTMTSSARGRSRRLQQRRGRTLGSTRGFSSKEELARGGRGNLTRAATSSATAAAMRRHREERCLRCRPHRSRRRYRPAASPPIAALINVSIGNARSWLGSGKWPAARARAASAPRRPTPHTQNEFFS